MRRTVHLATLAVTVTGLTELVRAADPLETNIDFVAAYAIDSDTHELVRYAFETNEFMIVGVVRTAGGVVIEDCESLAYVGQGNTKGMYTVPTAEPFARQLVKIDPMTAEATVRAPVVCPSGRKITGMTSAYDSDTDEWYLLAASSEDLVSDPDRIETRELIRIDPFLGTSTIVATQAQLGNGRRFEGLGIDADGDLWAVGRQWFYRIHQEAGYCVEEISPTGLDKAEAFEIAFGDAQPSITIPGVDPSWTTKGVFFVADESSELFGALNPAGGSFVEYLYEGAPSSFWTKDPEGLIVLTLSHDPLYGSMVGFD